MAIETEDVVKMLSTHGFELTRKIGGGLSGFYNKDGCRYFVYMFVAGKYRCLDIDTDDLWVLSESDTLYFSDYQDIGEFTSAFEKLLQQILMELL